MKRCTQPKKRLHQAPSFNRRKPQAELRRGRLQRTPISNIASRLAADRRAWRSSLRDPDAVYRDCNRRASSSLRSAATEDAWPPSLSLAASRVMRTLTAFLFVMTALVCEAQTVYSVHF